MYFLIIAMAVITIYSIIKWFIYYCAVRGLLYYLGTRYDDLIDAEKAKELTNKAVKRTISEFFRRS
ncbi:hypothetical protein NL50_14890 [Clostridium acetobutylicum]|nr:hypothetical protein NL50_14890 [Clostridium acetobutylicum]